MQINRCSSVALDQPPFWSLFDCSAELPSGSRLIPFAGALLAIGYSPARASGTTGNPVIETGVGLVLQCLVEGRRTASGRRYNPSKLTAASPWVPVGIEGAGDCVEWTVG